MARSTTFICAECGHESAKWHGRCPGCEAWNTLTEERVMTAAPSNSLRARSAKPLRPVPLSEVEAPAMRRFKTRIGEFDRVLGGGLVPGSLVLIGGAPRTGPAARTR